MSVSIKQALILGAEVKIEDLEKVGFDDDFWEAYAKNNGYPRGIPCIQGLHFLPYYERGVFFVGVVVRDSDETDGFVQCINLETLVADKERYAEVNALFDAVGLTSYRASLILATTYN